MSTRTAASPSTSTPSAETPTRQPAAAVRRLDLHCPPQAPQRLELEVRRSPSGRLEVRGSFAPAGSYREIEVCAGFERCIGQVDSAGAFSLSDLPGPATHVKVTLRGGSQPPIVLTRVPVAG